MGCSVKRSTLVCVATLFACAFFPLRAFALEIPDALSNLSETQICNVQQSYMAAVDSHELAGANELGERANNEGVSQGMGDQASTIGQSEFEKGQPAALSADTSKGEADGVGGLMLTAQQESVTTQIVAAVPEKQLSAQGVEATAQLRAANAENARKYDTPLPEGMYMIATANSTTRVLDVAGGSKGNGANVLLWDWHNYAWQKWLVEFDDSGLYTITNVHTGKVLDIAGAVAENGRNVLQWQGRSANNLNQRWILEKSDTGFVLKSAMNQRFVLDCTKGSAANGANVEVWTANGGGHQRFNFVNLASDAKYERVLEDGIYTMGASSLSSQHVEVQSGSPKNSANVELYADNNGLHQRWSFQHMGDGFYNIVNLGSGLALDVEGCRMTAATNVLQFTLNGGKNQLWGVVKNVDGTYSFYSALNGLALDIHGGSTSNLANIETYYPNGAHNQKFVLSRVAEDYGGAFVIYSRLSQDLKAVDVPGGSFSNDVQLALWTDNQELNQRYLFERFGSSYSIRSVLSGKYLTVSGNGIVQASAQGASGAVSNNQLWNVAFLRDGFQISSVGTGEVMSVGGSKAIKSAKMQVAASNGSLSQRFLIRSCETLPRGLYAMKSAANSSLALDASGGSFANGTNAIVWKSSNLNNQKFALTLVGDGYYRITLALGGTVLGATGGDGASVKLYNWSGVDSQLWKPVLVDGGYTLLNKETGMGLAAVGDSSGSDVVQKQSENVDAHKWRISRDTINLRDMDSFVSCLSLASGSSSLAASRAIVGFSTSSSQWKALQNALVDCWNAGIDVGFLAVDCNTGMALSINADRNYFGASTIKGLYITYLFEDLIEKGRLSLGDVDDLMYDAIVHSDNGAYNYLRSMYGSQAGFNAWLASVGVGGLDLWDTYSSRTLAKAWVHMLEYENSNGRYVGYWRSIFNHSDMSVIKSSLGGYRTVYSKPGWMDGGWAGTILNDGGIVKNGDRSYVIAVMTTAYPYDWHKGKVENVVRVIDGVFASLAVCR